jgi:hypothetical protein
MPYKLYRTRRRTDNNERLQRPLPHRAATVIHYTTLYMQTYARRRREDPLRNRFNALFECEDSITRNFGFVSEVNMNITPLGLNLCRLKNFVQWVWIIYKLLIPSTSVMQLWKKYFVPLKASVGRTEYYKVMVNSKEVIGKVQLKRDGTRWRAGGEVKEKLANGVGSQYSSHYLGTWCIQHYYRWCAHLGCQKSTELTPPPI